jgi:hypothetical protein
MEDYHETVVSIANALEVACSMEKGGPLTFFNAVLLGALVVGIFMHLSDALDALVEVVFVSYTLA